VRKLRWAIVTNYNLLPCGYNIYFFVSLKIEISHFTLLWIAHFNWAGGFVNWRCWQVFKFKKETYFIFIFFEI